METVTREDRKRIMSTKNKSKIITVKVEFMRSNCKVIRTGFMITAGILKDEYGRRKNIKLHR